MCAMVAVAAAGETRHHNPVLHAAPGEEHYKLKSNMNTPRVHYRGAKAQDHFKRQQKAKGYPTSMQEHKKREAEFQKKKLQNPNLKKKRTAANADIFQFQSGFAFGLQYSERSSGPCVETINGGIMAQIYIAGETRHHNPVLRAAPGEEH